MVRWCIRLTRLTLVCEMIRYRLVQVRQNLKKRSKNPCVCSNDTWREEGWRSWGHRDSCWYFLKDVTAWGDRRELKVQPCSYSLAHPKITFKQSWLEICLKSFVWDWWIGQWEQGIILTTLFNIKLLLRQLAHSTERYREVNKCG